MTLKNYPWPAPPGSIQSPLWTGQGFRLGRTSTSILSYEISDSSSIGWTSQLTRFHEEMAGSDHFIDVASREQAWKSIHRNVKNEAPVILDVGCSSGFMLSLVRERMPRGELIGCDVVKEPLEKLAVKMVNVPFLQFDLSKCPLPDNSIDVVILLNVLEHIRDDLSALRQVHRILRKGGIAVIEVPAGPNLYDVYDKLLLHYRRYSLARLRQLAKKSNLRIIHQSHLGFLIYPGFFLAKLRGKRFLSTDQDTYERIVARNIARTGSSRVLERVMRFETAIGAHLSFPTGIRCLLVCEKS